MKIVVTGAGGFVGRHLVAKLSDHEVVALDHVSDTIPEMPNVRVVAGDISDPNIVKSAFSDGCDAVIHLATIPGGAAEENPDLARRINEDATMALADAAAKSGDRPRFVFASSIAVFGDPMPAAIDDATPLAPKMYYGAHKAMMEEWLATLTRRGDLSALSIRLSGVVARPRGPSGMKSAFMSDVFHALKAGEPFVVPVSRQATMWLTSVDCATNNFQFASLSEFDASVSDYAVTLPTVRLRIADLVSEIARQTGSSEELVRYEPDADLEAAFGSLPPVSTAAADAMGFRSDGSVKKLVARALATLQ